MNLLELKVGDRFVDKDVEFIVIEIFYDLGSRVFTIKFREVKEDD